MPESLLHFPALANAMGFKSTRAVRQLCHRYSIPVVKLSERMNALRQSDYELLLSRASEVK